MNARIISMIVIFISSVVLVFVGQMHVGYMGLLLEVIGLIGLIVTLYLYNKKYK